MIDTLPETNPLRSAPTAAGTITARNFSANLRALRRTQPALSDRLTSAPAGMDWVFARDGSLTAMEEGQRWWAGCSLPGRAAEFMLRKAELPGTVICFLSPVHAGQLRVALDRMSRGQALLALTPDVRTVGIMLACEDFSDDIAAHRLYFAAGDQWETELDRLLEEIPGLPTPTQFIRPILADSSLADALVAPAQKIFADHSTRRAQRVRILRQNWKSPSVRRICVIAPSHFRLWDDIGAALAGTFEDRTHGIAVSRFDPDDPASASPAAMAAAAAACDAIVTPNSSRADLPDLAPDNMPWATWLTVPRIPPPEKVGEKDTLLVADPRWKELAVDRGWNADRIFIAAWPAMRLRPDGGDDPSSPGVFRMGPDRCLAIISDTRLLEPPPRVMEYSSHRLLWEAIGEQLGQNPFALIKSADAFLSDWMSRVRVEEEGFDRALFLDGIVLHGWQQGIARALLRAGFAVKLFGSGWHDLEEFRPAAAGPVRTRQQLQAAAASVAALVHVWPVAHAHPIESAGRPVVRAHQPREAFLREAKLLLSGCVPPPRASVQPLSAEAILSAVS
jgi:hypothetical protein